MKFKYIVIFWICGLVMACGRGHDDSSGDSPGHEGHNHDSHSHEGHIHSDHEHDDVADHDHEAHGSETSGIHIDAGEASHFGIDFEIVKAGDFSDVIKTSGMIEASPSDIMNISAKKSGIVTLSSGVSQGKAVKTGETIGRISSSGLQGGDATLAAGANLQAAKAEYERLKPLYEEGLVTASVYREAERTYREAEALAGSVGIGGNASLVAPCSGTIISLNVSNGDYVETGAPVASISKNISRVLKADLPARLGAHLHELETANFLPEGRDSLLKLSSLNGKKISGTTTAGSVNGYIPVYFSFNGNSYLAPGGYAEVFLICGTRHGVISVPRQALVEIQGNKYVYVALDNHSVEKRLVQIGASDGERVEIIRGLQDNDRIVSKGASVVRMMEVSAIAPPAHTHNH